MRSWAAAIGGAAGAALALVAAPWDALVSGFGGEVGALGAARSIVLTFALATTVGALIGLAVARALDRRGGAPLSGGVAVLSGAALALAALPRCAAGDPASALVLAPALGFLLPALVLVAWAWRR